MKSSIKRKWHQWRKAKMNDPLIVLESTVDFIAKYLTINEIRFIRSQKYGREPIMENLIICMRKTEAEIDTTLIGDNTCTQMQ